MKTFASPLSLLSSLLLLAVAGLTNCTDPITVGSDLLDDDRVTIGFNSSLEIEATTVLNDSINIFDASNGTRLSRHLLGFVADDIFGNSRRDIYLTPEPVRNQGTDYIPPIFVDRDSFILDSVVLILPYDTAGTYGDLYGSSMEYELYEMLVPFPGDEDFNSDETLPVASSPISTGSFTISEQVRLVSDTIVEDSVLVHHVRIPMPEEIIDRIRLADTGAYASQEIFWDSIFNGIQIRISEPTAGFLSINARNFEAGFRAYFTKIDTSIISFYPYEIDFILANYDFDRSNSLAEELLNDSGRDDLTLVEGAAGLMTRVEILNADTLAGTVINQAQLEFYLEEDLGFDYEAFPPAEAILLFYDDADGRRQVIEDVEIIDGATAANRNFFLGGLLETDEDDRGLYRVNLSAHLQSIVDGDNDPVIYIRVIPSQTNPARMILRNQNATELRMNLKVAFTQF